MLAGLQKRKRKGAAYVKRVLKKGADALFPSRETREYQGWIAQRIAARKDEYKEAVSPGLFSILTPVWNGSPVHFLRKLAGSVAAQNESGASEWVLLDNGCSDTGLLKELGEIGRAPWVKLVRTEQNVGITGGLRACLESATGRYVLPVDADDLLYPDALRVVASAVKNHDYPPLLYTDEDKVAGSRVYQPYLKPDWDPVLLLNSAYIAHLGVIEREKAIALGAYSDAATEGSPDWDLFVRFLIAGYSAVHIPEVIYSWRAHGTSTAEDTDRKPYVDLSQKKVLQRFLDAHPLGSRFSVERNALFEGGAHWHFRRQHGAERPFRTVVLHEGEIDRASQYAPEALCLPGRADPRSLKSIADEMAIEDGFIYFIHDGVTLENPEWQTEASGIAELHPDTAMIGGWIRDRRGLIVEAGLEFGPDGTCSSPNRGEAADDPGYFGQLWKQRSVNAVSTRMAAIKARFLLDLLRVIPVGASLEFLGAWAGAYASKTGKRIVYTPFLRAISAEDGNGGVSKSERELLSQFRASELL